MLNDEFVPALELRQYVFKSPALKLVTSCFPLLLAMFVFLTSLQDFVSPPTENVLKFA